jgi:hypothetical protein
MGESRGSDAASNFEVNFWLMTIHLHEIVQLHTHDHYNRATAPTHTGF